MCEVVHFKKDKYNIYIGRLPNNEYNKWSYPKKLRNSFTNDTQRQDIIDAYDNYLLNNVELIKKWFTLVELIVVITILAILWTIAFISLQWYSLDARNSTRIADLNNIKKALTLNKVLSWRFTPPTLWVEITYSWSEVWTQWSFWEDTRIRLWKRWSISKVPVDPLTKNEYTYSVLNTDKEMSLAAVMEWWWYSYKNNLILDKTYAAWKDWNVYIIWNYNWKIAKTSSWVTTYILAVPSIISWDITLTDIITLLNQKKLSYNWSWILPSTYKEWTFNNILPTWNIVNTWSIVVFSWSISNLKTWSIQDDLIDNLIDAYSWTIITNIPDIKEIVNSTWNDKKLLVQNIIKDTVLPKLEITIIESATDPIGRFIASNTKETVTDTETSLIWQSHRDINWDLPSLNQIVNDWCDTPADYCIPLSLDWYTINWRVPTKNELESLKDADWKIDTNYFSYKTDIWYAYHGGILSNWDNVNFSFIFTNVYATCWLEWRIRCVHD